MRIAAFVAFMLLAVIGGWFMPTDDCAADCAGEAEVVELADSADTDDCADDDACPEKDDGCDDCETCMCCASTAPAATVMTLPTGHPPLPALDRRDSATVPELRACAGYLPGVFKPPRA